MSLARLVYYGAVVGGWAAFLGWLVAEFLLITADGNGGRVEVVLVAGAIGAAIGAGVSFVAGLANGQWRQLLVRAGVGLAGGAAGGAIGGLTGDLVYSFGMPRAVGWLVMGIGIGVVDGIYEQSKAKIRNGLIGGAVGGVVGGVLFDLLQWVIASGSGMSSRATAFVVLGVCIGASIGLAQVVLKEAWLTVVDGYRAGRQLILSQPVITLGKAEHLPLPFLGASNQDLAAEHLRITRQSTGTYLIEDLQTATGTWLNQQQLRTRTALANGDVIKLGRNSVRFNERQRQRGADVSTEAPRASTPAHSPPPPPPPRRQTAVSAAPPAVTTPPAPTNKSAAAAPLAHNSDARHDRPASLRPPPPPPPPPRKSS